MTGVASDYLEYMKRTFNLTVDYVPFHTNGPWAAAEVVEDYYGIEIAFTHYMDLDIMFGSVA